MELPELTKVGKKLQKLRSQEGFPEEVTFELSMKGYVDGSRQQREEQWEVAGAKARWQERVWKE